MKTFVVLIAACVFFQNAAAQKTKDILKQQAGEGVKQGATIATEHAADKVTDKVLGKIFSKKNKKHESTPPSGSKSSSDTAPSNGKVDNNISGSGNTSIQTYSKYDFVPGAKVLVYDDFSNDAVGDFPENWNTNAAGETVTVSGQPGHWLMLNKKGIFRQDDVKSLPENFTYEFDLIYAGSPPFLETFFVSGGDDKGKLSFDIGKRSGVDFGIQPIPRDKGGNAHVYSYNDGEKIIDNGVEFKNNGANKIKVSVWRQKQRLRVYVDQSKVFDLPRAFPAGKTYNTTMFELWSDAEPGDKYLISNIKLAVGEPDTRNKLISEGKFSTTGILFDVNAAVIKPESYGTLKDIAGVLQDNANVRVKIIGHTDADGDAAKNLALSKKRAEAVKNILQSEFKIDGSRMETDGRGAADSVASNATSAGKAQNRRVEFVKM